MTRSGNVAVATGNLPSMQAVSGRAKEFRTPSDDRWKSLY